MTNFGGPVLIWSHFVLWVFGKRQGGQDFAWLGVLKKSKKPGEAWGNLSIYTCRSRTWSVQMFKHADGSCNRRDLAIYVNCQVHDERTFQWRDLSHITSLCRETSSRNKGVNNGKDQRRRNSITYVKKLAFQRWPCNPLLYGNNCLPNLEHLVGEKWLDI